MFYTLTLMNTHTKKLYKKKNEKEKKTRVILIDP